MQPTHALCSVVSLFVNDAYLVVAVAVAAEEVAEDNQHTLVRAMEPALNDWRYCDNSSWKS